MTARLDTQRNDAGMTLVEMLVVLAIIVSVYAVATWPSRPRPSAVTLDVAARITTSKLAEARARAIGTGQQVHVDIDPAARRLAATGDSAAVQLPMDLNLTLTSARSMVSDLGGARISFQPDGSSTGGVVSLQRAGRRIDIGVSWLTGQVEVGSTP